MYIEYPHKQNKDVVKDQIDKYVAKLNKLEFYSNFKIIDLMRSWNNYEMDFSITLKQSFLERRMKGVLQIKDDVIIIEFEVPDVVKNFVRKEKLESVIIKHLENVLEESNYVNERK